PARVGIRIFVPADRIHPVLPGSVVVVDADGFLGNARGKQLAQGLIGLDGLVEDAGDDICHAKGAATCVPTVHGEQRANRSPRRVIPLRTCNSYRIFSTGAVTFTSVPRPPGPLPMAAVPPRAMARSRMASRPCAGRSAPFERGAMPTPSSTTARMTWSFSTRIDSLMALALACRTALVSASCAILKRPMAAPGGSPGISSGVSIASGMPDCP